MDLPISFKYCPDLIRVGRDNDGGYVICLCALDVSTQLVSMGIGDDWSFERRMKEIARLDSIIVYDYSINFVVFFERFVRSFIKMFFLRTTFFATCVNFALPFRYLFFFRGNVRHIAKRVTNKKISELDIRINEIFDPIHKSNTIVKIDVEGSEYRIIQDVMNYSDQITELIIEFHDTSFLRDKFMSAIVQIAENFDLVHAHGNNFDNIDSKSQLPETIEMTFTRKSLHQKFEQVFVFPLSDLDQPNNEKHADISFELSTALFNDTY
jgi:hypothetical protein